MPVQRESCFSSVPNKSVSTFHLMESLLCIFIYCLHLFLITDQKYPVWKVCVCVCVSLWQHAHNQSVCKRTASSKYCVRIDALVSLMHLCINSEGSSGFSYSLKVTVLTGLLFNDRCQITVNKSTILFSCWWNYSALQNQTQRITFGDLKLFTMWYKA